MPRTRPAYPAELRQKIVDLARSGRSTAELAREFEPSENSIRSRVHQAERDGGVRTDGLTSDERQELIRLRRENRVLREERDIRKIAPPEARRLIERGASYSESTPAKIDQ